MEMLKLASLERQLKPEKDNPNHIHHIIAACLNRNPKKRITIDEVVKALEKITEPGGPF